MTRKYIELKQELDGVIAWFEQDDIDVDMAIEKHLLAEKIIAELRQYLADTELKIKKIKDRKL